MWVEFASNDGTASRAFPARAWAWTRALIACTLLCVPPLPVDLRVSFQAEAPPMESAPLAPAPSSEEEDHSQQGGKELAVVRDRSAGRRETALRFGSSFLSHHHGGRARRPIRPIAAISPRRERDALNGFGGALRC